MSQTSARLNLPFIQPAQAQKHVTHNEALRALDLLVQLSIEDDTLTAPPPSPSEGDCYLVAPNATGEWAGQSGAIAVFLDAAWQFQPPNKGWFGYVASSGDFAVYDGTAWRALSSETLQNAALFGLGMDADSASPFSAKVNAALWTALYGADGGDGDLIQTLNKETAGNNGGLVLQENFQTKALIGLFGNNDLRLSVSQDGVNFVDGLTIDPATGITSQPTLPHFKATTNYDNAIPATTWTKVGINSAEINDQVAFDAATNLFTAPVAGTYLLSANMIYKQDAQLSTLSIRLVKNGTDVVTGSIVREAGQQVSEETGAFTQVMVQLNAADTIEVQVNTSQSAFIMANTSTFWGYKIA